MCGIAGWFCWGAKRPPLGMAKALLLANETRGRSAAGLAYRDEGNIMVRKGPGPASELISYQPAEFWEKVAASPIALLHARATTKGSEKENQNNHPVNGFGWTVVHNGMVHNDDDLWGYYADKRKRFAEVDTSAIPLVLSLGEDYESSLTHLTLLSGSISSAMWSAKHPDRVALVRLGGNPVYMFADQRNQILYWSSAAIAGRVMPSVALDAMRLLTWASLPEGKLLVLKPGSAFTSEIFTVERSPFTVPHGKRHTSSSTQTKAHGPAATSQHPAPSIAAGGHVSVGDDDYPKLKWDVQIENPKDKPLPTLGKPDDFSYDMFDENKVFESPEVATATVHGAYGRWVFVRGTDGLVTRYFKPRKAVRKFLLRHFPVGKKSWPNLPQPVENGGTPYDRKLFWENILVTRKPTVASGIWTQPGYMCPWCGWVTLVGTIYQKQYRCKLCNIQNMPYKEFKPKEVADGRDHKDSRPATD